jgi:hypothetical protein
MQKCNMPLYAKRLTSACALVVLSPVLSLADSPGFFANKTIQLHFIVSGSVCALGRCQEVSPTEGRHNTYFSGNGSIFDYNLGRTGVQYTLGEWRELSNGDRDRWDVSGMSVRYTLIQHQGSDELQQDLTITAQGKVCSISFKSKFKEQMFQPSTTTNDRTQLIYCRVVDGHAER